MQLLCIFNVNDSGNQEWWIVSALWCELMMENEVLISSLLPFPPLFLCALSLSHSEPAFLPPSFHPFLLSYTSLLFSHSLVTPFPLDQLLSILVRLNVLALLVCTYRSMHFSKSKAHMDFIHSSIGLVSDNSVTSATGGTINTGFRLRTQLTQHLMI